ncbi:MAG TPA: heme ABC exporter ATP-binding protein CcmA [Woeseiaceae bacterium]
MTAPPAISVQGLVVDRGRRRVLDDVAFEVAPGEIVGLLGPNGAGKTTTLAVLSTLLRPSAGDVRIAGHDLRTDSEGVRRWIGRVPQEIAVYPTMTARDNVRFFARLLRLRTGSDDVLERVGLLERADERVSTYSGGMQRRLNLACGLLGSPPVLLLDEPTVGVDPQSLERIRLAIESHVADGAAVLYTTHQMDEAEQLCDRVVLIDRGRIIAAGTPESLVAGLQPGLRIDVVTEHPLPAGWLGDLHGARELDATEQHGETASSGHVVPVAIAALDLAPSVLKYATRRGTVIEFHIRRPRLYDVFLTLTGRALRD